MEEKNAIKLTGDDAARMSRLYEEVLSRLSEMARITARTVDLDPNVHGPVFERCKDTEHEMVNMTIEPSPFMRIISNSDRTSTACYSYTEAAVMLCGGKPGG
jgi:hypothetical protein